MAADESPYIDAVVRHIGNIEQSSLAFPGKDSFGEIDDLIVSTDGKLTVAIVEVGGFLGVGKHRVAIPVRQFTQIDPKAILPGATKEALKKLPSFVYAQ